MVVIEHNLDVIKTADWLIDMGPEGGSGGGHVVVAGTPEDVAACKESFTGQALKLPVLKPKKAPRSRRRRRSGRRRRRSPICAWRGRRSTTSRGSTSRVAARPDERMLRAVGVGQVVAGVGYHLRRGPAPLHRIAVGLRPAVPGADAEAEGGPRQRPESRHRHRAEVGDAQPALDGGHDHRSARLPARVLRPPRGAAIAPSAPSRSARRRRTRSWPASWPCPRGRSST